MEEESKSETITDTTPNSAILLLQRKHHLTFDNDTLPHRISPKPLANVPYVPNVAFRLRLVFAFDEQKQPKESFPDALAWLNKRKPIAWRT